MEQFIDSLDVEGRQRIVAAASDDWTMSWGKCLVARSWGLPGDVTEEQISAAAGGMAWRITVDRVGIAHTRLWLYFRHEVGQDCDTAWQTVDGIYKARARRGLPKPMLAAA